MIQIYRERNKDTGRNKKLEIMMENLFREYDADGSGNLDRDEIIKLLADTCKELDITPMADEDVDELIAECDESGDGEFDFDELYDMVSPI